MKISLIIDLNYENSYANGKKELKWQTKNKMRKSLCEIKLRGNKE